MSLLMCIIYQQGTIFSNYSLFRRVLGQAYLGGNVSFTWKLASPFMTMNQGPEPRSVVPDAFAAHK
jgi:hypothetical protein